MLGVLGARCRFGLKHAENAKQSPKEAMFERTFRGGWGQMPLLSLRRQILRNVRQKRRRFRDARGQVPFSLTKTQNPRNIRQQSRFLDEKFGMLGQVQIVAQKDGYCETFVKGGDVSGAWGQASVFG
jgi:hypothetical protein